MSESPSQQRAKRQRIDKHGRFAALERLKNLKGSKNKYEVGQIDNVFDEVTEKEYANRVISRAEDDWIEADGSGYVEDGREIFDDEEDEAYEDELLGKFKNEKSKKIENKKRLRDVNKPVQGNKSIRSLFGNVFSKKKDKQMKLDEDDILTGILGEIDPETSKSTMSGDATASTSSSIIKKSATLKANKLNKKSEMAMAKEYMQNFTKQFPKTSVSKIENTSDDEILERILKPTIKNVQQNFEKQAKHELKESIEKQILEIANDEHCFEACDLNDIESKLAIKDDNIKTELLNSCLTAEEFKDDMAFNILEDDENPLKIDTNVKKQKEEIFKKEIEHYKNLVSNWENICNNENDDDADELLGSINVDNAHALTNEDVERKNSMKFWFWDAWDEPIKFPGKVFLFGKTPLENNLNEYKSVCVTIENVEKCLYLLPREYVLDPTTKQQTKQKVTFSDVYEEFNSTFSKDFKFKKVTKNFAFSIPNVHVPQSSEYLMVRYDGKHPSPDIKRKYNTIAHIFGANTNSLEIFLLECKIKGPAWLYISNYSISKLQTSTWCSLAISCSNPSSISVLNDTKNSPPPPLVVTTINVRTALHPKTQTNEIVMIACLVNTRFPVDKRPPNPPFTRHFCGFTRPSSQNWPIGINDKLAVYKATKTRKLDSERALLSWFLTVFKTIDADLIVTHDANDCQLDIICDRLSVIKLPMWSRIGRLNISNVPKKLKDFFVGRMICDIKSSAEELIKSKSYDLDTLCQTVLKINEDERVDVSNDELHELFETSDGILKLITLTLQDCSYVTRLMCELNVLPLALQITNICGNLMGRTLQGGRSERNEYLLLHAFDEKDYIVPDKKSRESNWIEKQAIQFTQASQAGQAIQSTQNIQIQVTSCGSHYNQMSAPASRKKPAYSGGLVLDPLKGFYEKYILIMDFNSLYPSIIQEYNICFTTVSEPENEEDTVEVPDANLEQGVLPRQIRNLVECRREVKKLIVPGLDRDLKNQYNIRQLALKLTANSMYGCLGFSHSRFYAKHLAALVTQKGRDILLNTKSIVTKLNYEVIYGDTDSIMINTHSIDYDDVFKIGNNIKQAVNKIYRHVELDIDGVYKYMLLLNKKKYAAVTVSKSKSGELICAQEHKGLDIVRRDWSQISVMAGKMVLDQLLNDLPLDERIDNIHSNLEKIRDNINDDAVPVTLLTITRQLTKAPREYQKFLSLPHVQVALRMNSSKSKRYKKGDMVSYVICLDGTENSATQRGYHLNELKTDSTLKIDKEYYLANQIHPVVSRLLKPIEGTDGSRIALYLGLDPNKYKESGTRPQYEGGNSETFGESIIQSNAAKYRVCNTFTFKCVGCKTDNIIAKPFVKLDNQLVPVLQGCSNKDCSMAPIKQLSNVRNHLTLALRKTIREYYDNWMICDEPNCNQSTRTYIHVTDDNNRPLCLNCKQGHLLKTFTEGDLYKQLKYYQFMFDLPRYEQSLIRTTPDIEDSYKILKEYVDHVLEKSSYQNINLSQIFESIHPKTGVVNYK